MLGFSYFYGTKKRLKEILPRENRSKVFKSQYFFSLI